MSDFTASRTATGAADWQVSPAVAKQAVEWWLRLQACEPCTAMDTGNASAQAELHAWRTADPQHERAWQRIMNVNQRLSGLVQPNQAAIAKATLAPKSAVQRRRVVQTLAVIAFGFAVAWQVETRLPWRSWGADARTARGERRHMLLDDGTQLVLNGATQLGIEFSAQERRLHLFGGEVLITTAVDVQQPARPFFVQTAEGEAQALGTRFMVRAGDDGMTQVSVFEGAVRLKPRRAPNETQVLQAGQQATLYASEISHASAAYEDSTAWVDGMLIARGMPLSAILSALQPYSAEALVCEPSVADLRISGTYPLDHVAQVLETLDALPDLQVRRVTRWWGREQVVVGRAATP